ncbi:protein Z-dependent protease inhibitor [Betta splendens]|uniref:Protein Z-dependent protease inhibitor n=1 Tax=Betta splendens TaxID=158456 RepID=A0A6P7LIW3_BETSP|nr:protein Z-dependent protease inhibitor [Betta splendens]
MALEMKIGFIFSLTSMYFITPIHQAQVSSATISDLSFKNMDFAMNLYRKISASHDRNIFFSPLSISTSFASLLMASDGVTHKELIKGLNLHQLRRADQPELIPKLFHFLHGNITQNGSLILDQAMTLFMDQHFEVEKTFEEQMKRFFGAEIKTVDFTNTQGSIRLINEHIKRKTKNKVTEIVSSLDSLTKLMLINTIVFQGGWQKPFNSNYTQRASFYIDNYNIVQVQMMVKEKDDFYVMEDVAFGVSVLKIPYQDGVSMLILLPRKGMDYTGIDDEITAERLLSWVKRLEKNEVEINLPKFKMVQSYSLPALLSDMGMASAFSTSANLTRLSKQKSLKVSEALHKAVIEVDEAGTSAAAVTTIGITPHSLPNTFIVNRPFVFFIYHENTNCVLFMGRVIDPTKN